MIRLVWQREYQTSLHDEKRILTKEGVGMGPTMRLLNGVGSIFTGFYKMGSMVATSRFLPAVVVGSVQLLLFVNLILLK